MNQPLFLGIIGNPIGHSLSPLIHNRWLGKTGRGGIYLPFKIPPARLKAFVRKARRQKMDGFNVTIPHKETILPLMNSVSREAKAIGAVNTVIRKGKNLTGENTDWQGYLAAYHSRFKKPLAGKTVVVLGAGGSSRAILYALCREKVGLVIVANRTVAKAEKLVGAFNPLFPKIPKKALPLKLSLLKPFLKRCDLLINTTSVGLNATRFHPSPIPLLSRKAIVSDLVYNPLLTPLLKEARKRGHPILPGLPMLIYQAAFSFRLWCKT
ncbi:MAG: shikimate dehydrogenase [Deltaproteobacteria bacterium]|nr:shikimate dehydrogenase [Deltaproteobacteria bacterium]